MLKLCRLSLVRRKRINQASALTTNSLQTELSLPPTRTKPPIIHLKEKTQQTQTISNLEFKVKLDHYKRPENLHYKILPNNEFYRDQVIAACFESENYDLIEILVKESEERIARHKQWSGHEDKDELKNLLSIHEYNIRNNLKQVLSSQVKITPTNSTVDFPLNSDLIFVFKKKLLELDTVNSIKEAKILEREYEKLEILDHAGLEEEYLELKEKIGRRKIPVTLRFWRGFFGGT